MFAKGKKSRYLALSVALALGGAWCGGASYQSVAEAADLTISGVSPVIPAANEAKDEGGAVVGAAAGVNNDAANDAPISGKTTEVSGTGTAYAKNVYGGYSIGSGNVTGNKLDFKEGRVTGDAYAGYSVGSVTDNTATMTGGKIEKTLYGGYSQTGSVSGNKIHAGQTDSALTGNVHFKGDVVGGQVKEGKGKAENNEVLLKNTAAKKVRVDGYVYGARTEGGDAIKNKVVLDGVAGFGGKKVYGAAASEAGNVKENTVEILKGNGGTSVDTVIGGESQGGTVEKNKVKVDTTGAVTNVIGGQSAEKGNVTGNEVDVQAATGLVDVVGGRAKETGTAEGNKVKIGGAAVIGELNPTGHPNHPYNPTSGRVLAVRARAAMSAITR